MPVTRETLRIAERVRIDLDAQLDAQTRTMVAAWARAWGEVSAELNEAVLDLVLAAESGRVTRAAAMRSTRLARALAIVGRELEALARQAGVTITGDLATVVEEAAGVQGQLVTSQLPPGIMLDFARVDPRALAAIVARSTQQIHAATRPLAPDAVSAMRHELVRGVAVGANPRETARRMVNRAQGRFEGGLTRALVIARTETLDAHRQAAEQAQQAEADLLTGWQWTATLGPRTCPACWAMHGSVHPLSTPGPLDHHQGRCTRLPKTKSWAELGLTGVEEPPDLLPDARAEFLALDAATQREILGSRRYEAWKRGAYPMEAWAQRRSTDGWRDAYHVSPVPGPASERLAS